MLKSLSVGTKISLVIALAIGAGLVTGGTMSWRLSYVDGAYRQLIASQIEARTSAIQTQYMFKQEVQEWKDILLRGHDGAAREKYSGQFHAREAAIVAHLDTLRGLTTDSTVRRLVSEFAGAHTELTKTYDSALQAFNKADGKNYWVVDSMVKGKDRQTATALDSLQAYVSRNATATVAGMHSATVRQQVATAAVMLLVFAAVVGISIVVARNISAPLARGVVMMQEMAKGHLGLRLKIDRQDEIGVLATNMDAFADNLQQVVGTMKQIAEGDLSREVAVTDDRDEISPALRGTIVAIRGLVTETVALSKAGVEGRLATRGNAAQFQGGYRAVVTGINDTLDAVVRPITEASEVLSRLAARDLSARMTGTYQNDLLTLKTALNTAVQHLADALAEVAGSAEQVAVASQQIAAGSQLLAQGTSEQAAAVEEVSASLQEVSSMSQQNATNAQEAKGLAERGRTSVKGGIDSMDRLTTAIQKIKERSDATARIVKTIDEIAFQTNLLALNAAVEAARAGDAGKGFAVVADEVRALAIRSADAAKSTAALIEEGVQASTTGVALNAESLKALQDIDAQMDKIGEMLAEIATASNEQNQGVGQITTAIEQVNQTTQSAAANAEESAATSEELSAQAAQMQGIVGSFQLDDAGPAHGTTAAGPPARRAVKSVPAPRPAASPNRLANALRSNGKGKAFSKTPAFDLYADDSATLDSF